MLDQMIKHALEKALPPEVMALMTPEKVKEIGDAFNGYIINTRESLARIETQNAEIIRLLSKGETPSLVVLEGGKNG